MPKYSDAVCDWLQELGYTHCFFVAGGNIMHLLESASRRFTCVPTVHEVAAGIAAEYFTESGLGGKAFAMVTAGPGLTNIVTAFGGAYLESRELLVLGGQVKTADLAHGQVRQRGIQEIDGVSVVKPLSKHALRLDAPLPKAELQAIVKDGFTARKGPVFLEFPLDVQGRTIEEDASAVSVNDTLPTASPQQIAELAAMLRKAERPLLLIGGGITRETALASEQSLARFGVPVATTWNAADRIPFEFPLYVGRPNTWGQRYANLLLQQADVIVALGTRLGMQQTGFNWQQFAPLAKVVHVDVDQAELNKGHPKTALSLAVDANALLCDLLRENVGAHAEWVAFCREVKEALPLIEPANQTAEGYLSPFAFATELSDLCTERDVIVPCSSGGAFTVMMQSFRQKRGQVIITNKGSASMGYGLSGAVGLALAAGGRRTILVEGDGGFSQNVQEIGTASVNKLPLKIFIFDDHGYASIRMTQRNYFGGKYVGCDIETGLGMPQWEPLFLAYGVPCHRLKPGFERDAAFLKLFDSPGPAAFLVPIDPQQTYFPKITSRVLPGGGMESNPLHLMSPALEEEVQLRVARHLIAGGII